MTFSSEQYSSNLIAEQFYDQIEMGRVYLISKGSLKPTQKSGKSFSRIPLVWEGLISVRLGTNEGRGAWRSEKAEWISVKASVSIIKTDNFFYEACPWLVGDRQCNKKVTNNGDGRWQCERYLLLQIEDHTGLAWVTDFQESGEDIMGISTKELYLLKYEEQDDAQFGEIVKRVLFSKFLFKLKVKEESFNDEQRVKIPVIKTKK
ncbi:hypothetical protein H6P81_015914 [Aristolochia fimbriata]|uniref:Replication factor A C-terminal domain-containing protein n=1 Tax=Aristolochia fimbriata TaxID=158543 RepID=A0AAV7E745_ARIFI|nr:hypothetical protein H6P81_015914 [Aristolochia fimbriata]